MLKLQQYLCVIFCLYFSFITNVHTCPSILTEICQCKEIHNGVNLDCSNNNGYRTMEVIRENQGLLGLIQSLTLANASLGEFSIGLFKGLYIKKLDLSHNNISVVHRKMFDGINPVLEELTLSYNNLKVIPSIPIAVLSNLLSLDISNNKIQDIDEENIFPSLNKLSMLNLARNQITSMHTNSFQNIKNSIQTINLGHNKLSLVPSSAIRGSKQLQSLHLHENEITKVDALSFLNLPILNLLNLAGNRIDELNRQAFLNVPNLRYLYLSNNRIKALAEYQFQTFDRLEMLDITNNTIQKIPPNCLSGLKQLRQLYLGNNKINSISNMSFVNSPITLLVLSDNDLLTIEDSTMDGLPSLQQVSFRNNKIKSISLHAFYSVPSLVILDLAKNKLTNLEPSTFLAQLNMLFTDLSENLLGKIPYSAFSQKKGTVLLKENPLVCTEGIHMLQGGIGVAIKNNEDKICNRTSDLFHQEQKLRTPIPKLHIQRNPSNFLKTTNYVEENDNVSESVDRTNSEKKIKNTNERNISENDRLLPTREYGKSDSILNLTTHAPVRIIEEYNKKIQPFPIPFLKMGPVNLKSKSVNVLKEVSLHTLPPTVVVDPGQTQRLSQNNYTEMRDSLENREFSLPGLEFDETSLSRTPQKTFKTTNIMVLCIGIASIALMIVIIGLCLTKHWQLRNRNTSANIHATQTHNFISQKIGNTNTQRGKRQKDDSPTWIYNPGSSYCNYYK